MKFAEQLARWQFLKKTDDTFFIFFSTALSISFKFHPALSLSAFSTDHVMITEAANVDAILFFLKWNVLRQYVA